MDRFHETVDVFTDLGAAGNQFAARCALGENDNVSGVAFTECHTEGCHAGSTCIENVFTPVTATYWGGWSFQNGVLPGEEVQPACNWGTIADACADLTGATRLRFWARGKKGGERVEFFVGGVGWNPTTGQPVEPYRDSLNRVPGIGQATTLSDTWTEYTIDLTGQDLSCVHGGFGWVANVDNNPGGATFFLDDIRFELSRLDEPRFLRSYETLAAAPGDNFDTILENVAWTYDNAVALIAYLASSDPDHRRRAGLIADALVYAQEHDRYYTDGRLRNAYQAGSLKLPHGWEPHGRRETVRMPGWWSCPEREWLEDRDQVGTTTGNVAWAMLGLLQAYRVLGQPAYLGAAERMGAWVEDNVRNEVGPGGYTGGFDGWEATSTNPAGPTKVRWKSTEHNLDLSVAFMRLFDVTGDPAWRERALHAKAFVRAMWEACGPDHFATGTVDEVAPNCDVAPEDVNTWGLMALGEAGTYGRGIAWVGTECRATEPCFGAALAEGIDFNDDRDGIWWEGTAHTAVALGILGDDPGRETRLENLRRAQLEAPGANGLGLVAACRDQVTTGFPQFQLYNRLHVGATGWLILAELGWNPFWGIPVAEPVPHEGEGPGTSTTSTSVATSSTSSSSTSSSSSSTSSVSSTTAVPSTTTSTTTSTSSSSSTSSTSTSSTSTATSTSATSSSSSTSSTSTSTTSSTTATTICPGGVVGDPGAPPTMDILEALPATGGGATGHVRGSARNLVGSNVRVVCYAFTNAAYIQPFAVGWGTDVCSDGSWSTATHGWGKLVCLLVDPAVFPQPGQVYTSRDDELCELPGVLACDRYPEPRVISFSGAHWEVKDSVGEPVGPELNVFSASDASVSLDAAGLHLNILNDGSAWTSAEVLDTVARGYGVYTCQIDSRLDTLARNEVASCFLYASATEEIDLLECSPSLVPAPDNCQYVVQPFQVPGNQHFFTMPAESASTHRMVWLPDRIEFLSWKGHDPYPPQAADVIASWVYTDTNYIPVPRGAERRRANVWRRDGLPPESGTGSGLVLRSYEYEQQQ